MTDFNLYMRPEFGAALALVAMCFVGPRPWRELASLPVVRMFGVFAAFLVAQAAYATWVVPDLPYPSQLTEVAKLVRLGVFCCVVGWWLSVRPSTIPALLGLMVLGLLVAVLYHMPWSALPDIWAGRVRPRFGIPENLSGQLAAVGGWLALCLLVGIWRDHPRGRRRNWLLALGLLAYAGSFCVLVFSQSRGAWLAFLVASPLSVFGYWLTRKPRSLRTLPWQPIVTLALVSVLLLLGARDIFALRFAGAEQMLPEAAEPAPHYSAGDAGVGRRDAQVLVKPKAAEPAIDATPATTPDPQASSTEPAPSPAAAPVAADEAASGPVPAPTTTQPDAPLPTTIDTTVPANKAVSVRLRLYELGVDRIRERPWLGWGLNSIPLLIENAHLDLAGERHVHLHSAYLDALAGIGLVGSLLLLSLFVLVMRELVLAWRSGIISTASFWALVGCVAIVLIANAFDSLLWRFEYARAPQELLFGCCIAYALIRRRREQAGADAVSAAPGS
ncbi:MAG TPA: O-antigen ligase family protein [Lysobacter sp.]